MRGTGYQKGNKETKDTKEVNERLEETRESKKKRRLWLSCGGGLSLDEPGMQKAWRSN